MEGHIKHVHLLILVQEMEALWLQELVYLSQICSLFNSTQQVSMELGALWPKVVEGKEVSWEIAAEKDLWLDMPLQQKI